MSDLAVVHLVWAPLGTAPLRRFLESYARHSAGVEHRLLIVYNGFDAGQDLGPWQSELEGVAHEALRLEEPVLDLAAYRDVAERVPAKRYCFLNSYSVVKVDGWLELLSRTLDSPGVGLVGVTGSWASQLSHVRFDLRLGGVYSRLYEDRARTQLRLREVDAHAARPMRLVGKIAHKLKTGREMLRRCVSFERFPAHHVRTNGFIVERDVWMSIRAGALRRKLDVYVLESGRRSVTRQVEAMGLSAVVVGRDGRAYVESEWAESNTFWQRDQENLIIADNQTATYQDGDRELRTILSQFAWGQAANPSSPPAVAGR